MPRLILASRSPRRRFLIRYLQKPVSVQVADVDEESVTNPDPATNALRTAHLKAEAVNIPGETASIIIAADTVVTLGDEIFGKPGDDAEARQMLRRLRGRTHEVHTGIALLEKPSGRSENDVSTTHVTMRMYSDESIEKYVASGDPLDKAGAYAIQHRGFSPVARLQGCYTGVVGLPLCMLRSALEHFGVMVDLAVDIDGNDYRRCDTCRSLMVSEHALGK